MGSSPLARGLPAQHLRVERVPGIIPARAGFTASSLTAHGFRGDHPRSRGVYAGLIGQDAGTSGSSPLARGLRLLSNVRRDSVGIIPARAGFTPANRILAVLDRDHPRSRGVYVILACSFEARLGSSPLARGLRTRATMRGTPSGDHPRSRGVYFPDGVVDILERGSSPLARGLQCELAREFAELRIIPARAGFTTQGRAYDLLQQGSSPLARGLLAQRKDELGLERIIPARAGFTPAWS